MGMGIKARQFGFTIVEVTIVLAVSGGLAVFLIAASLGNVNQQRYQDAVMTVLGDIQQEYIASTRVSNSERGTTKYACNDGAQVTDVTVDSPATASPRGASECVIIGRLINIDNSGRTITAYNLVGREKNPATTSVASVVDNFHSYNIRILTATASVNSAPWDVSLYESTNNNTSMGIALLHSPLSGATVTYVKDTGTITDTDLAAIDASGVINDTNIHDLTVCINSNGLSSQPVNAVVVLAGASGPNGVTQRQAGNGC